MFTNQKWFHTGVRGTSDSSINVAIVSHLIPPPQETSTGSVLQIPKTDCNSDCLLISLVTNGVAKRKNTETPKPPNYCKTD